MKKLILIFCLSGLTSIILSEFTSDEERKDFSLKRFLWHFEDRRCYIRKCHVQLPQHTRSPTCIKKRKGDVARARKFYVLTDETQQQTNGFPHKFIPVVNQTMTNLKFYYAVDPDESRFLMLYSTWNSAMRLIYGKILVAFTNAPFSTYKEYLSVYYAYHKAIKGLNVPQYFVGPDQSSLITEVIKNNRWQEDAIFVQRRLVGGCPFFLRKVTPNGNVGLGKTALLKQLNKRFDFDKALSYVYKKNITMKQAIDEGRLYVLYHEDHNGLKTIPDILDKNTRGNRTLVNLTSPITLFVLGKHGKLSVAAIQLDYKPASDVFTPRSTKKEWLLAKAHVEQSDHQICQGKIHLGHIHFVYQVICAVYKRHFSTLHPLYDVLKYHCEGTIPQIMTAYPALSVPGSLGDLFYAGGYKAFVNLSTKAYNERKFGQFDLEYLLHKQGLDDKILYYPFRDDGRVIWKELSRFSENVVHTYYRSNRDVCHDKELQSFANEVSADGKRAPDGGKGKFTGFPAHFAERGQVIEFLLRMLWYNVIHTTANYPLDAAYVPLNPPKIYKDSGTAATTYADDLPDASVTVGYTFLANSLISFRANRIMDYYDKVQDGELRHIVWESYSRFHGCIQKKLQRRNAERKRKNQLGFQSMEPKWLPNSVHV